MELLAIVAQLETLRVYERFDFIRQLLTNWGINFDVHTYKSGRNLLVMPVGKQSIIGVSSHYDVVPGSPGANDNASAVVVCLSVLNRLRTHQFKQFGVAIFFFDEEESGLKGSRAYVNDYGIGRLRGLINLEMLGQGDQIALWPVDQDATGIVLAAFESAAQQAAVATYRFDQIVTNTADHIPFRQAGLADAFTLTCISDADRETASHYYKALVFDVDRQTLYDILQQAPLFRHYHQPTDWHVHLSEKSLQLASDSIWRTLLALDKATL